MTPTNKKTKRKPAGKALALRGSDYPDGARDFSDLWTAYQTPKWWTDECKREYKPTMKVWTAVHFYLKDPTGKSDIIEMGRIFDSGFYLEKPQGLTNFISNPEIELYKVLLEADSAGWVIGEEFAFRSDLQGEI